jgi:hypothetical protein
MTVQAASWMPQGAPCSRNSPGVDLPRSLASASPSISMFPHPFRDRVQLLAGLNATLTDRCPSAGQSRRCLGTSLNEFRESTPMNLLPSGSVLISPEELAKGGATGIQRHEHHHLRHQGCEIHERWSQASRPRTGPIRSGEVMIPGCVSTRATVAMRQPARGSFRKGREVANI